jgi:acetyl/propionyl-CoA carboxylase alpha subunit
VTTNRDMLVRVLRSPEFLSGDTTTDFVTRVGGLTDPLTADAAHRVHAAAAALSRQAASAALRPVQPGIPSGWRNNPSGPEVLELKGDLGTVAVGIDSVGAVQLDGHLLELQVHLASADLVDATVDDVRRRYRVAHDGGSLLVDSPLGSSRFEVVDRLPAPGKTGPRGGLTAPMPGMVVRVATRVGDAVEAGQPLLVLEAMKMEHTITSPHDGVLAALAVQPGDQVERGAVLAEVTPASEEGSS